jgi:Zn-finger nucleic acid-binding protein
VWTPPAQLFDCGSKASPNVIIEDCERCSLNWLEYGELERIVQLQTASTPVYIDYRKNMPLATAFKDAVVFTNRRMT